MKNLILPLAMVGFMVGFGLSTIMCERSEDRIITVYTPEDIVYIDYKGKIVYFESSDESMKFDSFEGLEIYVENLTADHVNNMTLNNDLLERTMSRCTATIHPDGYLHLWGWNFQEEVEIDVFLCTKDSRKDIYWFYNKAQSNEE